MRSGSVDFERVDMGLQFNRLGQDDLECVSSRNVLLGSSYGGLKSLRGKTPASRNFWATPEVVLDPTTGDRGDLPSDSRFNRIQPRLERRHRSHHIGPRAADEPPSARDQKQRCQGTNRKPDQADQGPAERQWVLTTLQLRRPSPNPSPTKGRDIGTAGVRQGKDASRSRLRRAEAGPGGLPRAAGGLRRDNSSDP